MELNVGPKGRVVIPAQLRKAMNLEVGSRLTARLSDGQLILEAPNSAWKRLQTMAQEKEPNQSWVDELIAQRRAEAKSE